jgi:hypothetical protein
MAPGFIVLPDPPETGINPLAGIPDSRAPDYPDCLVLLHEMNAGIQFPGNDYSGITGLLKRPVCRNLHEYPYHIHY